MSKAYKCDRCGILFEKSSRPFWIESDLRPNVQLDICDSCKAEFENWLNETDEEEEDNRSCSTCMHNNCSASEDPCRDCDGYSNYEDKNLSRCCGNCIHRTCSIIKEPCIDCVGHNDHPNYTAVTHIKGGK